MNLPMVKQLCRPFCFNAGAVVAGGERGRLQTTIGAGLLPSSPACALVSQWGVQNEWLWVGPNDPPAFSHNHLGAVD